MDFKALNRDNFMLYAMGNYSNPDCVGINEFNEDISKIKYVKRLLKKFKRTEKIRIILLLNHLIILGNVFGQRAASRMLFYKLESDIHPELKTVLLYLEYIDDDSVLDGIRVSELPLNGKLAVLLKNL